MNEWAGRYCGIASSPRRLAMTEFGRLEYGNSKNAIPNYFARKPLIFPDRAKKIFAEIWSAKFRADCKPWIFLRRRRGTRAAVGIAGVLGRSGLQGRVRKKARKLANSTILQRILSESLRARADILGDRLRRSFLRLSSRNDSFAPAGNSR
jgi:hypothetical protein